MGNKELIALADRIAPLQYATGIAFTYREFQMVLSALSLASSPSNEAMREAIARIIDPHSFMDIPFTNDPSLLDMVKQSKGDALRKADRIVAIFIENKG